MDLSTLKAMENEVELHIPSIGGIGFFVSLRAESSKEVQSVNEKFRNKLLEDGRKGNKNRAAISDWYKIEKPLAHIAGWRWENPEYTYKGEQPVFSREKAIEMLKGSDLFAFEFKSLIDEAVGDTESFLAKSV